MFVCFMVFNATFNYISVLLWRSVLLVEEAGGSGRKPSTCRMSLTNFITMVYTSPWLRLELSTSVVIGTDCMGSCKSNYHTPQIFLKQMSMITRTTW